MNVGALYQLESGTVVRVVAEDSHEVELQNQDDGTRFTVRREPFTEDVRLGYIQRVEAVGYRPVSDG